MLFVLLVGLLPASSIPDNSDDSDYEAESDNVSSLARGSTNAIVVRVLRMENGTKPLLTRRRQKHCAIGFDSNPPEFKFGRS